MIRNKLNNSSILIISLSGIGDVLMAMPMVKLLRSKMPNARIDILTQQIPDGDSLTRDYGFFNNVFNFPFYKRGVFYSLAKLMFLRKLRYDVTITTYPQNHIPYNLFTRFIGGVKRLGVKYNVSIFYVGEFGYTHTVKEQIDKHVVDNNVSLLSLLGIEVPFSKPAMFLPVDEKDKKFASDFVESNNLKGKIIVGFHPGSGTTKNMDLKRWPAHNFSELARMICNINSDITILLFGGSGEILLMQEIVRLSGLPSNRLLIAETPTIKNTASLINRCSCFVANDTLLMHLASIMNVFTVRILGMIPEVPTRPYGTHTTIRKNLSCAPCYNIHGFSGKGIICGNEKYLECLSDIKSVDIFKIAERHLREINSQVCINSNEDSA